MRVFVEGGGDSDVDAWCRRGFQAFLRKAGFEGRMPKIVPCGGRSDAYKSFCKALKDGEHAFLLIDSEAPVLPEISPLELICKIDTNRPCAATGEHCHLMVQCMEAWLLADREALLGFFGEGFRSNRLPALGNSIESIARPQDALLEATRDCNREKRYRKGTLSFQVLALVDYKKVIDSSPWAKRFIETLLGATNGARA